MNCLESCKFGALRYGLRAKVKEITPEKNCIKDCIIVDSRSTDENEKGKEEARKTGEGLKGIARQEQVATPSIPQFRPWKAPIFR